jgi:hypothetical protein
MHADQQSAALAIATRPPINVAGKVTPAAKIEIPDAKIRALGNLEGFLKCWQQWFFYVVEDSRHCASPALWLSALAGIVFPRLTAPHPIVDLGNFEFPKATNRMSGQVLCIDPSIDRVPPYAKVLCNLLDGHPRLSHFRTPSTLKWTA